MSTIEVYTFEDARGEPDSYTTLDPQHARERAQRYGLRVVAREYEYADSETVWDFTPDDDREGLT